MTAPQLTMQRARVALLLEEVFFGSLLLGLRSIEDPEGAVTKTMATDGASLWWNSDFVSTLSEGETRTVLAHEAMHCALLHPLRRGDRDASLWNQACDHAVNLLLENCNEIARQGSRAIPFPWPKCGALRDPVHAGKSAEEIYTAPPPGDDGETGGGGMGDVLDAPGDDAARQEHESSWKVAAFQAAQAAQKQGKLPACLARLVGELLDPPARWQDLLRSFVIAVAKDDYSWIRPNPRYSHSGFILPSLHSQRLGRIAVAVDTSGSIDDAMLDTFLGEIENIISECKPEAVTLLDCDSQVNSIRECDPNDPLPRNFEGGGGTDFTPVFDAMENDPPVCLVYLTDLEGSFPDIEPAYPVLWAKWGQSNTVAPFGDTIAI